ncbi:MAG: hypothetical protein A3K19_29630 [Lentisphaerae bacterium RIFOXYB12_FULL_65_16]|nr:MAG: hypothetical protein A3K18_30010 [Lentisphaerae bacterium RIFOXYA12_64_32]OGV87069.1 MAG: hypothetical protein A3K19_29630 [Lentisphaerae bacterium RIFOXYB12_FULL_65_16]
MRKQNSHSRVLAALVGVLFGGAGALWAAPPQHFTGVHVSQEMVFIYGNLVSTTQPGDEVAVFSAAGVLCGAIRIDSAGKYPAVAVYKDDPMTPARDGALAGEVLSFRLWDATAAQEYSSDRLRLTVVERQNAGGNPYWSTNFDAYRVDIAVNDEGTTWVVLTLEPGWNLLSLPFDTSPGKGPRTVLTSSSGVALYTGGVWVWDNQAGGFDVLRDRFAAQQGFWVLSAATGPVQTTAIGGEVRDEGLALQPGWNLVGPVVDSPVANLVGMEKVSRIWRWNSALGAYDPVGQDGVLQVGRAYWVHLLGDTPCVLRTGK